MKVILLSFDQEVKFKFIVMAFYIEKAIFVNRAPFDRLELDFKDKGINVLSAINGNGKTTILSHITDALYELASKAFHNEFEGKETKYYRVSSPLFNINLVEPSYVYFRFKHDGDIVDYVDIRNKCTEDQYNQAISLDDKIVYSTIQKAFAKSNNIKLWTISDEKKIEREIFSSSILTYFPSYRYETPSYLNDPYEIKLDYAIKSKFAGYLENQIEVVSDLPTLVNWFLDVLLDMKLKEESQVALRGSNLVVVPIHAKEKTYVWDNLNMIVSSALSSKHYEGTVRLGIGTRNSGATRVAIMNDINPNIHKQICPSIFNLSAGELSLISIFGEILHQADNNQNNIQLEDINGMVLIDEVDKHLHITLQKDILPKLFKLFPNIQFIVSSHSPFMNMGLAEQSKERAQIIDLDNDGVICEPTSNQLYIEVYNMMVNENKRFYDSYKKIRDDLKELDRPLVITEGKTDIIHILKAKEKLGIDIGFKTVEVDCQPDGDSNLQKMLEQLCKVRQRNKIIAIFDRDIPSTVKLMDDGGVGYKAYGNNVYAFCISAPQARVDKEQKDISIEYLYSDDEIHAILPNGCSLYFGNEFSDASGRHIVNKDLILRNQSERGKAKIVENNGGQAVLNLLEENVLAKKSDFAEAIMKEEILISQESWNNFKHIFDKIEVIINL